MVTLRIRVDEQQAVESFRKLTKAEQDAVLQSKKLALQSGQTSQKVKQIAGAAEALGKVMLGGGIIGGATKFLALLQESDRYLAQIAAKSREAGENLVAFAMMQAPGTKGERAREVAAIGGSYGVKPGEAWSTVQAFQAGSGGDYAKGLEKAKAAFSLTRDVGIPAEYARIAIGALTGLGMTAKEAAQGVYAAGEQSELTPQAIAQGIGAGLPVYGGIKGGPVFGLGVAAALTTITKSPEEVGTQNRQIGLALQASEGARGKTWKKLGFPKPGEDPVGQILALKAAGIDTAGALDKAGFSERQSQGLVIALRDPEAFLKTVEKTRVMAADIGGYQRVRGETEAEVPEVLFARQVAELEAKREVANIYNPMAEQARATEIRQRSLGLRATERGFGYDVDEQSGRPSILGSTSLGEVFTGLRLAIDDLRPSIIDNTAAQRARDRFARQGGE